MQGLIAALLLVALTAHGLPPAEPPARGVTTLPSVRHHPRPFGTKPLPISVGAGNQPANNESSGAAVSGDNRKTRLVAFQSAASNLVPGDTNARTDVFVWQRPRGRAGLMLNRLTGRLTRVSVGDDGTQANGDSTHPSLDGSIRTVPHCIAFESTASNLTPGDGDPIPDIFVRNLRSQHTYLVSGGILGAATRPSIDGTCHKVAFEAAGAIWIGSSHGGPATWVGTGIRPNFSRDGHALVWTDHGLVKILRAGRISVVGPGANPHVSDEEYGLWGVVFDSYHRLAHGHRWGHRDVYMRIVGRRGGSRRTILISKVLRGGDAYNGGITVYGQNRGIVVFGVHEGGGSSLWYYNKHTGHIDDLAFTSRGALYGIATSARANFVAFTARQRLSRLYFSRYPTVYFKHLVDGQSP